MPKSGRAARKLAHAWLEGQSGIQAGCRLQGYAYDQNVEGRLFSVNYFARPLQQLFRLVEFYVLRDGTIAVISDQRRDLRDMSDKAGEATESRFFEVMESRTYYTPSWFQQIERARQFFDKRGIDAFAFVDYKAGERRLRIPIQLKSSRKGAETYHEKHPLCSAHGVVVIVVNPNKTDEQLRRYVYGELGAVRKKKIKDCTRFTELHQLLGS